MGLVRMGDLPFGTGSLRFFKAVVMDCRARFLCMGIMAWDTLYKAKSEASLVVLLRRRLVVSNLRLVLEERSTSVFQTACCDWNVSSWVMGRNLGGRCLRRILLQMERKPVW